VSQLAGQLLFICIFQPRLLLLLPLALLLPPAAAAAVALKSMPIIKYRLDFGGVPSAVTSVCG